VIVRGSGGFPKYRKLPPFDAKDAAVRLRVLKVHHGLTVAKWKAGRWPTCPELYRQMFKSGDWQDYYELDVLLRQLAAQRRVTKGPTAMCQVRRRLHPTWMTKEPTDADPDEMSEVHEQAGVEQHAAGPGR